MAIRVLMGTTRVAFRRPGPNWFFDPRYPAIGVFWHEMILAAAYYYRNHDIAVLVSEHRDGELIAKTIHRLGFHTARGSSTHGGARGLVGLIRHAEKNRSIAFTVDGPRGPRHVLKMGPIYLAQKTGLPIVPVAISATPRWRLPSWDRFAIPKPFSRVLFEYGEPVYIPQNTDVRSLERYRRQLQAALRRMTAKLEAELGHRPDADAS